MRHGGRGAPALCPSPHPLPLDTRFFTYAAAGRPGQRVIVNGFGDLIVRPFPLELSLNLNLSGDVLC